jgi:hypothetical protein
MLQLRTVIEKTAGMYGDLQGIAGKALDEIDGNSLALNEQRGGEDPLAAYSTRGVFISGFVAADGERPPLFRSSQFGNELPWIRMINVWFAPSTEYVPKKLSVFLLMALNAPSEAVASRGELRTRVDRAGLYGF